ncbi:SPRY-domain-containing protein [Metschnikowia bicuspidata var. bicuspidata NRRL YB-4993]|uniref:SPRY-domain-containing protein n=1 Tax=Metschnikowia bicuspidata var. bicuspidata NRRL YB-4993 TaxID=869754 RepID=A0A1A0HEA0_9ASCO|nr:SPRY-domain-containing protein [Metschnikowia bicuspidata var. bicuspidata NRRL YB-4993]OBA22227.1 SPRY-domain-containing protein [Metschnikowia bicuspidata var. bicuspidata NRRL YB-4993]
MNLLLNTECMDWLPLREDRLVLQSSSHSITESSLLLFSVLRLKKIRSIQEDNRVYLNLNLDEQELYFQAKDFLTANPYLEGDLTLSQNLSIQEKGVRAWEFVRDSMLTNNDILIIQKYEINFFKRLECSVLTNLPIPKANEVYYFESKIFSLPNPEETILSIGISVKPYPWFRLPGRHAHSISYDSDGHTRHNEPFPISNEAPFPKLIEGDVVGIGYKVRSGTVFFTRNGKKLSELRINGHSKKFKPQANGQIFPIIGANNLCSIHVNIGQLGFVFIEGNVKKWGFAPLQGNGPAPPAYNPFNDDILLERSDVDELNGLTDRENDFPPDFLDIDILSGEHNENGLDTLGNDLITMHSLLPDLPPCYDQSSAHAEYYVQD